MGASARQDRRTRLAEVQAAQQAAQRRRTRWVVAAAVGVAVALVVPTAVVVMNAERRSARVEAAAAEPIAGAQEFSELSATHTQEQVSYTPEPPVGGDHHPTWQDCGFYAEPVVSEHAVHSLEHGAVWLTYDPDLAAADVAALRDLADQHPYLLVSPYDGLAAPVVASAWGVQVALDGVGDDRLEPFLVRYLQGPQTPEPGASCSGGVGA